MSIGKSTQKLKEANQANNEQEVGIEEMLQYDEGSRLHTYKDSKGIWTVGIGHNIEANDGYEAIGRHLKPGDTINTEEQSKLFQWDLARVNRNLQKNVEGYDQLKPQYKTILQNMNFQMGDAGVLKFKKTLQYMKAGNDAGVAQQILNSKMGREDSPNRAKRLAKLAHGEIDREYVPGSFENRKGKLKHDINKSPVQIADDINTTGKTVAKTAIAGSIAGRVLPTALPAIQKTVSKIASTIYEKFTKEYEKESTQDSKQELSTITVEKPKKKIADESREFKGWQRKVIELLTKIANNSRKVTQTKPGDTISISQALVEKDETETVNLPVEKEQSWSKNIVKGIVAAGAVALPVAYANANATPKIEVDNNKPVKVPVKKSIEQSVKTDNKSIKVPVKQPVKVDNKPVKQSVKLNLTPLAKPLPKQEIIQSKPVKSNFKAMVLPSFKSPISIENYAAKATKKVVKKNNVNPLLSQSTEIDEDEDDFQQIVINNVENVADDETSNTIFLQGDKYDARQDLKNIKASNGNFGTGLFRRFN